MKFSHLHNHTQYSLLDGASGIKEIFQKAVDDDQPAVAITDHGNMFGVYNFVMEANKHKNADGTLKVKPIVGCEFYLVENRHVKEFTREKRDKRYHQLLLAKNPQGYRNLLKLCTLGYTEGLYSKFPRIDKELVEKYSEGLIATTCCLGASVPQAILRDGEDAGEKEFKWWFDIFGDDFYVEFQRHGIPDQDKANASLMKYSEKYNCKMIASNDSHYVENEDFNSHDLLLCINTGEKQTKPVLKDYDAPNINRKDYRFGFFNDQFYMKTTAEMLEIFKDIPQAIDNTNEIVDKVELVSVTNDLLLPNYEIPPQFKTQDEYLSFLTYEGAKRRYTILTPEIEERLQFELGVIEDMGFAGYFLIVSDIIMWSKRNDVFVGSGRGSAAGSVVAYCTDITNIDPMKYDLLFERFLNPDRKSMPDIDTDFDDLGRGKVITYIVEKYGQEQVAQIITHNSMAAKMSIKDVGRVMDYDLGLTTQLTNLVPTIPGISLNKILKYSDAEIKSKLDQTEWQNNVKLLQKKYKQDDMDGKVLREAAKLEGTIRNTGIHAAGILIGPKPLDELMPMCRMKDIALNVTQFDGRVVENAGAIKVDILGLTNLTLLKQSIQFVKDNHGVELDLDTIPMDDAKTFALYQRADTFGTFQFASDGMRQYLKQIKPDKIEDLIALNALFRPGPMAYIPDYIKRKHGHQEVKYDLDAMEEHLKETYGITVYQEQVMLLSQKLANFTRGEADILRKAMGKKQIEVLNELKEKFLEGCDDNGHSKKTAEKIWTDWEAFAQYAFNKSHSTCYAYLAYHTAFFKANYPAEYMTALLNAKAGNIEAMAQYMAECKRMGLKVLGPDINRSKRDFSVNTDGEVSFGLSSLKNVGDAAVEAILEDREENGPFENIFDLSARVKNKGLNRKTVEALVEGGAFDSFETMHRAMFFAQGANSKLNNLELILKYGSDFSGSHDMLTNSLFGEMGLPDVQPPKLAECEEWTLAEKLKREKGVLSFYITAHPLDNYQRQLQLYNFNEMSDLSACVSLMQKQAEEGIKEGAEKRAFIVAGYLSDVAHIEARTGTLFCKFNMNDFTGGQELLMFKEHYLRHKHFLMNDNKLIMEITVTRSTRVNDKRPFISIERITLLEDVMKLYTKRLLVRMGLTNVDAAFMEVINKYAEKTGETELGILIADDDTGKEIHLGNKKIEMVSDLLEEISNIEGLEYHVESI